MSMPDSGRIAARFQDIKSRGGGGLVTFITAGDPDFETSLEILCGLPDAGADIVELGMPFSDPMADGPIIQASSQRALKAGQTLTRTLEMVRRFRERDGQTPLILMGYYNPIHRFGRKIFLDAARDAGVDGLIIVDLPPEEDAELCLPARDAGINFIRLATPTSDDRRLPRIVENASGFIYYVAIAGITGTKNVRLEPVRKAVTRLRQFSSLPVAVGFGIKDAAHVCAVTSVADAAVVGSAIVARIADGLDADARPQPGLARAVLDMVAELASEKI